MKVDVVKLSGSVVDVLPDDECRVMIGTEDKAGLVTEVNSAELEGTAQW